MSLLLHLDVGANVDASGSSAQVVGRSQDGGFRNSGMLEVQAKGARADAGVGWSAVSHWCGGRR